MFAIVKVCLKWNKNKQNKNKNGVQGEEQKEACEFGVVIAYF